MAITYSTSDDVPAMEYARASFLLFERGRRSAFAFSTGCGTEPPVRYWGADLGVPRGGAAAVDGVWRRRFARGLVVVNPSGALTVTASLGGTYVKTDGSRVATVALPPHSGVVLRRP